MNSSGKHNQDFTNGEVQRQAGMYDAMFQQAITCFALFDRNYNFIRVNETFANYYGKKAEEIVGRKYFDIIPYKGIPDEPIDPFEQVLQTKRPLKHIDYPYIIEDQPERGVTYWDSMLQPLFDEHGDVEYFFYSLIDVTERKRAEEALKESERRLGEAQRIAHVGYWDRVFDEDRIHWSDETYRIFGLKPQEQVISFAKFSELLHPEDREKVVKTVEEALKGKKRYDAEYRIIRPNGEVRIIHSQGDVTRDDDGRPLRMFGALRDITESKLAENALRDNYSLLNTIIETVPDCIFLKDTQGRMVLCNSATARLLGKPLEHILGKDSPSLIPPKAAKEIMEYDNRILKTGVPETFEETLFISDVAHCFLTTKDVFRDSQGKVKGLIGIARDITERKRAEEERIAHLHFFESMEKVNHAIQGTDDLEKMMGDVLDATLSIFDCDRAWLVYPCDPDAETWCVPMERTRKEFPGAFALGVKVPVDEEVVKIFQTMLSSDYTIKFGPQGDCPIPQVSVERFSVKSQIAMVIHPKVDKPYMFGLHQCSYPRVWTPDEDKLFQAIGWRLADALGSLLMFRNLLESERLLSEAQHLASIGSFTHNLVTGEMTQTAQMMRMFVSEELEKGVTFEKFIGVVHPDDRKRVSDFIANVFKSDAMEFQTEYRVLVPGQSPRHMLAMGRVTRDKAGKALGVIGTAQDITDRKRAEETMRENEAKLAEAQEIGGFGSFEIDITTWTGHCSPALCRIFGYENDEFFHDFHSFLAKHVHPDDVERTNRAREEIIAEGTSDEIEFRYMHPDGRERILHISRRILKNADERATKIVGTIQDITERREAEDRLRASEARFRTFVDHATDAFFIHDESGKILDVNREACESLGYSREELIEMIPHEFDVGIERSRFDDFETRLNKGEVIGFDSKHIRKDGKIFPVEVRVRPFYERGNRHSISFVRDITERKQSEEVLRASLHEKEVLLKELHHRVKNNLQFISSLMALQAEQLKDDAIKDACIETRNRIHAMAMVHENLYRSGDFGAILFSSHIESLCTHLFGSYGVDPERITLDLRIDDSTLDLDRATRCGLIINELVSNVIKHAFPDGRAGRITIQFTTEESGGHSLIVRDNGVGLPEVVDPDNSKALGLQLVSDLTEQLNGKLYVKRHDGTTFTINFSDANNGGFKK